MNCSAAAFQQYTISGTYVSDSARLGQHLRVLSMIIELGVQVEIRDTIPDTVAG